MKKITIILTAVIMFISASSFAGNDPVSNKIKVAFAKNFASASDIQWQKINSNYFALFTLNNQNASAAYNEEGELLATSRTISLAQAPLAISIALQDKYPQYTFSDMITEMNANGESYYTIKGDNEKNIITIKATSSGNLLVENKTRKK